MPADDRARLHDDEPLGPSRPDAAEHHPESAVGHAQRRVRPLARQDPDLLAQRDVLQHEMGARHQGGASSGDDCGE
jgi:hypothetical protein